MNTKHKYYEYIVAFAEGKEVEYRNCSWKKDEYCKVYHICAFDDPMLEFRIKPEVRLTVGYRRYIAKGDALQGWGDKYIVKLILQGSHGEDNMNDGINPVGFVHWLDTDWVYEEVQQ